MNQLLQHVERTWERVSDDPVDPTNNATERIIGLTFKIRSKTMRGFKSIGKVLAYPYLSSFLRGQGGICDLREVI
jgi:tRNA-binding EMAP/Myf-like protein